MCGKWRRVRLVPFDRTVSADDRIADCDGELFEEESRGSCDGWSTAAVRDSRPEACQGGRQWRPRLRATGLMRAPWLASSPSAPNDFGSYRPELGTLPRVPPMGRGRRGVRHEQQAVQHRAPGAGFSEGKDLAGAAFHGIGLLHGSNIAVMTDLSAFSHCTALHERKGQKPSDPSCPSWKERR